MRNIRMRFEKNGKTAEIIIPNDPNRDMTDIIKDMYPDVYNEFDADDVVEYEEVA